jgi:hypothetical protein
MLCFLDTSYHLFQQKTGLCKTLLNEYVHEMTYAEPSYICNKQASGIQYNGATARTTKGAEIKAAQTDILAIQGISFVLFIPKVVFLLFKSGYSLSKLY